VVSNVLGVEELGRWVDRRDLYCRLWRVHLRRARDVDRPASVSVDLVIRDGAFTLLGPDESHRRSRPARSAERHQLSIVTAPTVL
jgi:hypothetical protein